MSNEQGAMSNEQGAMSNEQGAMEEEDLSLRRKGTEATEIRKRKEGRK